MPQLAMIEVTSRATRSETTRAPVTGLRPPKASVAAIALLGRIAEPGTFVEKREANDRLELDVVTGVVSDEGRFATHGHTLLLRVTP